MTKSPQTTYLLLLVLVVMTGCNLPFVDLDRVYSGVGEDETADLDLIDLDMTDVPKDQMNVSDTLDDTSDADDSADVVDDTSDVPLGEIKLLMTELMINPNQGNGQNQEKGEFIEIYNAGERTIDLRQVSILIVSNEETKFTIEGSSPGFDPPSGHSTEWARLTTPLAPGEFFVFVHENDPAFNFDDIPGKRFYSWHWPMSGADSRNSLVNGGRSIKLVYEDKEEKEGNPITLQHTLTWTSGKFYASSEDINMESSLAVDENVSLSLNQTSSGVVVGDPELTSAWCQSTNEFTLSHDDEPYFATPGVASSCPP